MELFGFRADECLFRILFLCCDCSQTVLENHQTAVFSLAVCGLRQLQVFFLNRTTLDVVLVSFMSL